MLPEVSEMTGVHHHAQLSFIEMGKEARVSKTFLPRLPWNCDYPDLRLPTPAPI
jgi:hypothetical protein